MQALCAGVSEARAQPPYLGPSWFPDPSRNLLGPCWDPSGDLPAGDCSALRCYTSLPRAQQEEDAQREWHAWEAQLRAHAQAQFDNAAQQQGYGLSAADQAKAKLEATFLLDAVETAASEAAAEARRASAPLAEGWREAVAPGGRVYYYNEARETTWVKPVVEEDAPPEE